MYKLCLLFLLVAYIVNMVQTGLLDGMPRVSLIWVKNGSMVLTREGAKIPTKYDPLKNIKPLFLTGSRAQLKNEIRRQQIAANREYLNKIGKRDLASRMSSHSGN